MFAILFDDVAMVLMVVLDVSDLKHLPGPVDIHFCIGLGEVQLGLVRILG